MSPSRRFVPAGGLVAITMPSGNSALNCRSMATESRSWPSWLAADDSDWSTRLGSGMVSRPLETMMVTTSRRGRREPAGGFWMMTRPSSTLLSARNSVRDPRPAPLRIRVASASVRPTTSGTSTSPTPALTFSATSVPEATVVPAGGFWSNTTPSGTFSFTSRVTVHRNSALVSSSSASTSVRFTSGGTMTSLVSVGDRVRLRRNRPSATTTSPRTSRATAQPRPPTRRGATVPGPGGMPPAGATAGRGTTGAAAVAPTCWPARNRFRSVSTSAASA